MSERSEPPGRRPGAHGMIGQPSHGSEGTWS